MPTASSGDGSRNYRHCYICPVFLLAPFSPTLTDTHVSVPYPRAYASIPPYRIPQHTSSGRTHSDVFKSASPYRIPELTSPHPHSTYLRTVSQAIFVPYPGAYIFGRRSGGGSVLCGFILSTQTCERSALLGGENTPLCAECLNTNGWVHQALDS